MISASLLLQSITQITLAIFLYIVPGWAALLWLWPKRSMPFAIQISLATGLSIALYPTLLLWGYVTGIQPGALVAWGPGLIGGLMLLFTAIRKRGNGTQMTRMNADLVSGQSVKPLYKSLFSVGSVELFVLLICLLALIITRLHPLQEITAPAWGDSVHHTMIAQLIVENGGLFQSWQPYAPIQSYTYHFGLHTLVALWIWTTGATAPQAMLIVGQILNVLAIVALYPLATRLGYHLNGKESRWAGIGALVVAGFLSPMPAFYLNWGRYTQLAGQIILPILLYFFDLWWSERRANPRLLFAILLLATGLVLTHYRIAFIGATAGVAWGLWGLWAYRQRWQPLFIRVGGLVGSALLAVGLILPWLLIIQSGQLPAIFGAVAQLGTQDAAIQSEIQVWYNLTEYYPTWLWASALLILLLAFFKSPRLAFLLSTWSLCSFAITNPHLLGLPGTGWITNFALVLALYIPIAILFGWFFSLLWAWCSQIPTKMGPPIGHLCLIGLLLLAIVIGSTKQAKIVDPAFQMVTEADLAAFAWIRENSPPDAYFLVNGFLVYNGWAVAGSDAGWWLPLYTKRASTVPPILYVTEQTGPDVDKQTLRQITDEVGLSAGDSVKLKDIFCQNRIDHIFLGDRQGTVGFGVTPLVQEAWLTQHPDLTLLYQEGKAQVWRFNLESC